MSTLPSKWQAYNLEYFFANCHLAECHNITIALMMILVHRVK